MGQQETNDFLALQQIVEFKAEAELESPVLELSDEETRRLDARLTNIAKAQQEANFALQNLVIR